MRIRNAGNECRGYQGADTRDRFKPFAEGTPAVPCKHLTIRLKDLALHQLKLSRQGHQKFTGDREKPIILPFDNEIEQRFHAIASDTGNDTKLRQMCTDGVDQRYALANERLARSMHHQYRLLLRRFDRHKPHRWPCNCLTDGFGIRRVVLVSLNVRLHIARWH